MTLINKLFKIIREGVSRMKDRIPTYPGRVKLIPVAGQPNVYDMVRADAPSEAGTPINKATLLSDQTVAMIWGDNPPANPTVSLALYEVAGKKMYEHNICGKSSSDVRGMNWGFSAITINPDPWTGADIFEYLSCFSRAKMKPASGICCTYSSGIYKYLIMTGMYADNNSNGDRIALISLDVSAGVVNEIWMQPSNIEFEDTVIPISGGTSSSETPSSGLDTSDATAQASDILNGKTAYVNGEKLIGTMPNNGVVDGTIDGINASSYTVPNGYTSGGTVSLTNDIETELSGI